MQKACVRLAAVVLATTLFAGRTAGGEPIEVRVLGVDGAPVPGVVAFVEGTGAEPRAAAAEAAVMDQVDKQFLPHILVVRKGTPVRFPNSDPVAHHVYSFSRPNDFVLPLYKGNPHDPITFEHDGVVTLGCNIHDNMLGYIVVVDSDAFGLTDGSGSVTLAVAEAGEGLRVRIWSPRIRDDEAALVSPVVTAGETPVPVVFALKKRLRPAHGDSGGSVEWSDY